MPHQHPRPGAAHAKALQAAQDASSPPARPTPAPAPDRLPGKPPGTPRGLLPDGAAFHARYVHVSRRFDVSLTLPCGKAFTTRADGVYAAIRQLYALYHAWADGGPRTPARGPQSPPENLA